MLFGDIQHELQLLRVQDGAGGVAGVRDEDGAGVFVDAGLDFGPVGVEVILLDPGGDGADGRPGEGDGGGVVGIEGLGDDDLVPVVEDGGEDHLQRLAAAARGEDLVPCQLHADALIVAAHRVEIDRHAARGGVGHDLIRVIPQRLVEGRGSLHIRLADVQMIDFDAALLDLVRVGIEFPHGGEAAALHFG